MTHHQPDDPGHRSTVRFESTGGGREHILLGVVRIGEIVPAHGKILRCSVLFRLPDAARTMFGCTSYRAAHEQIEKQVRDWIEAAGLRA